MNVPKLRFKEFDGEWEYHQFSEIANRVSKSSNSNILPKVEFEDIVAGEGRLKKSVANKFDDRKGTLFQPNNILYGKLRPYLKNWLFPEFQGVALGDFWVFEAVNISPVFLYALIQSENYQRVANDTTGTKMPRSDWKKVSTTKFAIPMNIKEQEKIGDFFEILDKKIQLQQQKIDLLQEQKKGFFQKMFPKAGETQPEMRFDGFIGDWEEYKLGEIVDFYSGLTYSPDDVLEKDGTFVLRSSNIKDGNIVNADNVYVNSLMVNSEKIKQGDIIVVVRNGSRNLIGKHAIVKKEMFNTVIGAFMTGIRAEIPDFINALLDTEKFNIEISKNLGATINQITTGSFKKMIFTIPAEEEQSKIGRFFRAIDDSLEIQKQKLKLLQKQKQGFMQQMFI